MLTFLAIVAYFLIGAVFVYFGFRQNPDLDNDGYMMPMSIVILFFWPVVALAFVLLELPAKLAARHRDRQGEGPAHIRVLCKNGCSISDLGATFWSGCEEKHRKREDAGDGR